MTESIKPVLQSINRTCRYSSQGVGIDRSAGLNCRVGILCTEMVGKCLLRSGRGDRADVPGYVVCKIRGDRPGQLYRICILSYLSYIASETEATEKMVDGPGVRIEVTTVLSYTRGGYHTADIRC